ncbi:DUF3025 domain-containing protein [Pseudomarimonas salicorniae]|uniref:DUF3025 domain-containing protein n=1 Tax=Pseudomarimonas salicorniae TaxID=2933270 RepID=A0ABT0GJC4_9GAMM|nr:DUF3025 domain-containing protein [Lysobacter sp. CAU 1642]MCK7594132.1 DUF3025 domain-containing protein [Lysobacter sp. CAU 1642]
MRFRAPPRDAVPPACFDHPVFADFERWRGLLEGEAWPDCAALESAAAEQGMDLRFVAQSPALLEDGLHYEQRIAAGRGIATREANWHDLLNALIWLRWPSVKRAMNARQAADVARLGNKQRSRGQQALTHFDEAGVLVLLRDRAALDDWDRHAWDRLFPALAAEDVSVVVIGHALLEHALEPGRLLVGKALVVIDPRLDREAAVGRVSAAIACGDLLQDPQEMRPLPLMGLRGWHPRGGDPGFCREAECFQPVRPGRRYPDPLAAPLP